MEKIIELASLVEMKEEGQTTKRKSLFKVAEEQSQLMQAKRKDRLNSLTATSASSWIARRLLQNAVFKMTGNWRRLPNDQ